MRSVRRRRKTTQAGRLAGEGSAASRRRTSWPSRERRMGDPATRRPGDPATRRPGDPATRRPGDPATRRPGDPATRRPGDPATRRPGDPATRRPGDPATRRPGDPATRRPGDPATRRPGDPATRRPGDPATRRPGDIILLSEASPPIVNPQREDGFSVTVLRPAIAPQTPAQTLFASPTIAPSNPLKATPGTCQTQAYREPHGSLLPSLPNFRSQGRGLGGWKVVRPIVPGSAGAVPRNLSQT